MRAIEGPVVHGLKNGRKFGFPTANLQIADDADIDRGVYVAVVHVLEGPQKGEYPGCACVGTRPTIGEFAPNLEVYLLDFSGDLYGRRISVRLVRFLRGERKFDSTAALVEQMKADVGETRRHFSCTSVGGPTRRAMANPPRFAADETAIA